MGWHESVSTMLSHYVTDDNGLLPRSGVPSLSTAPNGAPVVYTNYFGTVSYFFFFFFKTRYPHPSLSPHHKVRVLWMDVCKGLDSPAQPLRRLSDLLPRRPFPLQGSLRCHTVVNRVLSIQGVTFRVRRGRSETLVEVDVCCSWAQGAGDSDRKWVSTVVCVTTRTRPCTVLTWCSATTSRGTPGARPSVSRGT